MTKEQAKALTTGIAYAVTLQGGSIVHGTLDGVVRQRTYINGVIGSTDALSLSGANDDGQRFSVSVDLADVESAVEADDAGCEGCEAGEKAKTAQITQKPLILG